MGLTLHYTVRLRHIERLPELVAEVKDICISLTWNYFLFDDIFKVPAHTMPFESTEGDPKPIRLQGILFSPPECEPVFLTFTPEGWSSTFLNLDMPEQIAELGPMLMYSVHVKTQGAGADIHIALVNLLKYLEKKYFSYVNVSDESGYWNTMDKAVLYQHFPNTDTLNAVDALLENTDWTTHNKSPHIVGQLEALLKSRL
jgi:hypothetical protein